MYQEQSQTPTNLTSKYDPALVNRMKKEILQDLESRREWQEEYYEPSYSDRPMAGRYMPPPGRRRVPEVDYDWFADRQEYEYQRNRETMKNQLRQELMALDKMNRRIGQISDPMVRQALVELLQEARQQGAGVQELIESLNTNNTGNYGSVLNRLTNPIKGIDRKSFGWGIGAALLGIFLLPSIMGTMRSNFGGDGQNIFDMAKGEFENILSEAKTGNGEHQGKGPGKGGK